MSAQQVTQDYPDIWLIILYAYSYIRNHNFYIYKEIGIGKIKFKAKLLVNYSFILVSLQW